MALNIYLLKDNRATKVWSAKNNRGPMWHPAQIDIGAAAPFQVNVIKLLFFELTVKKIMLTIQLC